jgi:hypothetical protein
VIAARAQFEAMTTDEKQRHQASYIAIERAAREAHRAAVAESEMLRQGDEGTANLILAESNKATFATKLGKTDPEATKAHTAAFEAARLAHLQRCHASAIRHGQYIEPFASALPTPAAATEA